METDADCMLRVVEDKGIEGFDVDPRPFPGRKSRHGPASSAATTSTTCSPQPALPISWECRRPRIAAGIESFEPYRGRFSPMRSRKGYVVVDDAYNANPASMQWAINTVSALPCAGRRVAILGGMRELGEKEEEYHRELGRLLKNSDISLILLLGEETKAVFDEIGNGRARFFEDKSSLIDFASSKLESGDIVLVKGSRAFGMDKIVEALV